MGRMQERINELEADLADEESRHLKTKKALIAAEQQIKRLQERIFLAEIDSHPLPVATTP